MSDEYKPAGGVGGGSTVNHKTSHMTSAASTNATSVKGSPGALIGGYVRNRNAAERFLKIFNKAAAPVVGTDVPVLTIGIPGAGSVSLAAILPASGLQMSAGLGFGLTTAFADADTGAVAAGDIDVNFIYR